MLKNDVLKMSACRRQKGAFLGWPWDFLQNAINIRNCSDFSILVNENWEQRRGNWHFAEPRQGG